MPEWLIEQGIGEKRAILVDGDKLLAAKMRWPGDLVAGKVVQAKLVQRSAGSVRGMARTADGSEILLDDIPREFNEGQIVPVQIKRAAMAERGRLKRAQGWVVLIAEGGGTRRDRKPDAFDTGRIVQRFPSGLWEQLWLSAWLGEVGFAGGSLQFSVTPAMTVVDVDGDLTPRKLAESAIHPLARALELFDLGGQIGIDFPMLGDKEVRREFDRALAQGLSDWPHDRTAINGFGFVQLVARLEGPSLLHRMTMHPTSAAARFLLRQAEGVAEPGALLLTAHPAVLDTMRSEWRDELSRRTGRTIRVHADPELALEGGFAQAVPL